MALRSGYSITIKAFVAVDPADLVNHQAALAALNAAKAREDGAADALFKLMEVETFDVRPVQRRGEQA